MKILQTNSKLEKKFPAYYSSKTVWIQIILITPIYSLHKNEKSYDSKDQMRITTETSSIYQRCNPIKVLHCSISLSLVMPPSNIKTDTVLSSELKLNL